MIFVFTLGFAPHRILKKGLDQFKLTSTTGHLHVYLNQHYPINKVENEHACDLERFMNGILRLDHGKNLGLHIGFNALLEYVKPKPDDVVIAYDPDSFPIQKGWDKAMVDVLKDKSFGWITIMNPRCKRELLEFGYTEEVVNGHRVWVTKKDIVNSTCAWRAEFLIKTQGLHESRPYYGHLESVMWNKMKAMNLKWGFLVDFEESDELRDLHDRDYIVYKWCHSHLSSWDGDFESWLLAGKPNPEDNAPEQLP